MTLTKLAEQLFSSQKKFYGVMRESGFCCLWNNHETWKQKDTSPARTARIPPKPWIPVMNGICVRNPLAR